MFLSPAAITHVRRTVGIIPLLMMPVHRKAINHGKFAVRPGLALDGAVDKLAKDGCEDEGREIIRRQILGAGFESGTISLNAINAEVFLGYIRIRHHDFICLPNLEVIAAITGRLGIPEEVLLPAKTPLRYPDSFAKFGNQADQAQGRGTKMFWVGKQFCCGDDLQRAAILERLSEPEKSELVKVLARQ